MKNLRKSLIIAVITSSLAIYGCGSKEAENKSAYYDNVKIYTEFQTQFTGEVRKLEGFENQTYYSMGLWDNNSNYFHDTTVSLKENEEFSMFLALLNCMGEKYNYTVILFDNYQQIEFEVDGELMNQCTVCIENGDELYIPIKINSLVNGKHDLIFAVFVDTYKTLTDEERIYTGDHDGVLRCTAIVGHENAVQHDNIQGLRVDTVSARTNGVVLNKMNGEEYAIEVGNLDEKPMNNVIIVLDNFMQVSISDDNSLYECILLNPGEEVIIPLEEYFQKIESDNTEHEITVISISDIENSGKVFFSNRILK